MASRDKYSRAHVFVSGRVQGVSFRWYAQRQAQSLGVTGWVTNLFDGRVEAVFEGDKADVERMVNWCFSGPPMAHIEDVKVEWDVATGQFKSFRVK